MTPHDSSRDRWMLFALSGVALLILGIISVGAMTSRIPSDSQTLLGVIVSGLLLFSREIVTVIRSFWLDERTGRLTDALAGSMPTETPPPADPLPVTVTNTDANPVKTEEAR